MSDVNDCNLDIDENNTLKVIFLSAHYIECIPKSHIQREPQQPEGNTPL